MIQFQSIWLQFQASYKGNKTKILLDVFYFNSPSEVRSPSREFWLGGKKFRIVWWLTSECGKRNWKKNHLVCLIANLSRGKFARLDICVKSQRPKMEFWMITKRPTEQHNDGHSDSHKLFVAASINFITIILPTSCFMLIVRVKR